MPVFVYQIGFLLYLLLYCMYICCVLVHFGLFGKNMLVKLFGTKIVAKIESLRPFSILLKVVCVPKNEL